MLTDDEEQAYRRGNFRWRYVTPIALVCQAVAIFFLAGHNLRWW